MNEKEYFKQRHQEMRLDWRERAAVAAGFGDEAALRLREVFCREHGRRRMTEAKRCALQSCEFFYRSVQILKEEFEAVFSSLLPELPPFPGVHLWDYEDGTLRLAGILDRLYGVLNVEHPARSATGAVRLLRWGSVLFAPLRERVGLYLSVRRVLGNGAEWTLSEFAANAPIQLLARNGIAVGEMEFLEYATQPASDLLGFIGRKCGVPHCCDWRKLQELLRIRYGAELVKYEPQSPIPPDRTTLAGRYGEIKKKEMKA